MKVEIFAYDNASTDDSSKVFLDFPKVKFHQNEANLGFAGACNQAVSEFLTGDYDFILFVNPDLVLEPNALFKMVKASFAFNADLITPKIHSANDTDILDACGMYLTPSLRHFDRGSQEMNMGKYSQPAWVFGGTGACLMITKKACRELILPRNEHEECLYQVYPQLKNGDRLQLFDEAYLAYREDADLAWRANLYGFKCLYLPSALAFHSRVVKNQKRALLDAELNALSVKNRFLLQLNNFEFKDWYVFPFAITRNILVLLAVLLIERTSWVAFKQFTILIPRGISNRRFILSKKCDSVSKWFFKNEIPLENE